VLPLVFAVFARVVLPYAPKSEFTFLVIVAFLCAYLTRGLGVYYLVGAFVVGVTAVRMRKKMPALVPTNVLDAVELFASFFVPFYFFKAGVHLATSDFTFTSLGVGFALLLSALPLRILTNALHRRALLKEPLRQGVRVGLALVPTLVFTIVIADILREHHALPAHLYGGLIVYTLANTLLPGLFLHAGRVAIVADARVYAPAETVPEAAVVMPPEPSASLAGAELHTDRRADEPSEP
jgi:Kef-type K+ transport system membrane component KefB